MLRARRMPTWAPGPFKSTSTHRCLNGASRAHLQKQTAHIFKHRTRTHKRPLSLSLKYYIAGF
jgi:hypothetical protein